MPMVPNYRTGHHAPSYVAALREVSDPLVKIAAATAANADLEATRKLLLEAPWELGAENLGWFAWNPILRPPGTTNGVRHQAGSS